MKLSLSDKQREVHERLAKLTKNLSTDYEPYGKAERNGPDCSRGCKWFMELKGFAGLDWGRMRKYK